MMTHQSYRRFVLSPLNLSGTAGLGVSAMIGILHVTNLSGIAEVIMLALGYGAGWSTWCFVRPGSGSLGLMPPPPPLPDLAELQDMAKLLKGQVDDVAFARMKHILERLEEIYPRLAGSEGPATQTIRRAVIDYVPTTIRTYLALPKSVRDNRRLANGRTPKEQIARDLEVLETELATQQDQLISGDVAAIEAHGAFLEQRFNRDDPFAAG